LKAAHIKFFISLCISLFPLSSKLLFAQTKSQLSEGKWYKIAIHDPGFYKIDYNWLMDHQINPNNINPKKVGLYSQGSGYLPQHNKLPRPIDLPSYASQFIGEDDSKWDKQDFLLFYAEGAHQKNWDIVKNRVETQLNPYTDSTYFFLRIDDQQAVRIKSEKLIQGKAPYLDFGYGDFHYEPELNNLIQSGREWLGDDFSANTEKKLSYPLSDYKAGFDALLYGRLANGSISPGEFSFQIPSNNIPKINIEAINNSRYDLKANLKEFSFALRPSVINSNWDWTLKYSANNGTGYLDYISLIYPKIFNAKNTSPGYWLGNKTDSTFSLNILNLESKHQIWHWNQGKDWIRYENPMNNPEIKSKNNSRIFIFDPIIAKNPLSIQQVENQSIRNLKAPNLLIITSETLFPAAQKYANYKNKQAQNYCTAVSTNQIYQEFSGGKQDITALRDYIKLLKNSPFSSLQYVLILGDASFDYKSKNSVSSDLEKKAWVPTYESRESQHPLLSYCTDDYFGILGEEEGELKEGNDTAEEMLSLGIGRIPARTIEEANVYINKLISYTETNKSKNFRNFTFSWIADDGDNNIHVQDAEDFQTILQDQNAHFLSKKVYLDQYPQEFNKGFYTSKAAQKESIELFNKNANFIHFIGHGAETGWTDEKIIAINELVNLKNSEHLPLLLTATCQFGRFDNPNQMSGAEIALLSNQGGAIGLISTSRPVFQSSNYLFGRKFYQILSEHINDPNYKLGDLFKDTKNASQAGVINRNIVLLGDPSLDLPWQYTPFNFTQRVLNPQSAEKITGTVPTTKNGFGEISIYGLPERQKTLGTKTPVFEYETEGKLLYKSRVSIKQGKVILEQISLPNLNTPKAFLRFAGNLENGEKILGSQQMDVIQKAKGNDRLPPKIEMGLLNVNDYKQSPKNPILQINLQDEQGLSFWGPNGEISEIVINDTLKIESMDYYSSELDRSDRGTIIYPLKNLPNGTYTVSIKCWDINENMAYQKLEFIVDDRNNSKGKINIFPNPSLDIANIEINTEDKWTDYDYTIILYNALGQKIEEQIGTSNSSEKGIIQMQLSLKELKDRISDSLLFFNLVINNQLNRSKNQYNGKIGVIR